MVYRMARSHSPEAMTQFDPPRLYLTTPPLAEAMPFLPALEAALAAGDVACVLVRLDVRDEGGAKKILRQINEAAQPRGAAVLAEISTGLVSANLALRANCDGVHFPAPDLALEAALRALQPQRIVGCGGLASKDAAMAAGEAGVDYLMFGEKDADGRRPDFADTLERVGWWAEIFNVPCVGCAHELSEVAPLAQAGAEFIALCEAVWEDARGPAVALAEAMRLASMVRVGA